MEISRRVKSTLTEKGYLKAIGLMLIGSISVTDERFRTTPVILAIVLLNILGVHKEQFQNSTGAMELNPTAMSTTAA